MSARVLGDRVGTVGVLRRLEGVSRPDDSHDGASLRLWPIRKFEVRTGPFQQRFCNKEAKTHVSATELSLSALGDVGLTEFGHNFSSETGLRMPPSAITE